MRRLSIIAAIARDCGPSNDCASARGREVLVGLLGGAVAAIALDTIFLAAGDTPQPQAQSAWTPIAAPTHGGVALGVGGQF